MGFGNYIVGQGGKESRIEVAEDFKEIVEKISTTDSEEEQSNRQPSPNSSADSEAGPETPEKHTQFQQETGQDEIRQRKPLTQAQSDPFTVKLELSGDEEPENVEHLILAMRRGLKKDISRDLTKTEEDEESVANNQESEEESDSTNQSLDSFMNQDTANEENGDGH